MTTRFVHFDSSWTSFCLVLKWWGVIFLLKIVWSFVVFLLSVFFADILRIYFWKPNEWMAIVCRAVKMVCGERGKLKTRNMVIVFMRDTKKCWLKSNERNPSRKRYEFAIFWRIWSKTLLLLRISWKNYLFDKLKAKSIFCKV